jgi:pyridinium-3,5-bisthiocarboxylic acid mononucleotide nickel chelatase
MKTLYLDLFSGISGDMFVGALVDLGVDPGQLEQELGKLGLDGYHLHFKRGEKGSIAGTKFDVHLQDAEHGHTHDHAHSHDPAHAHGHRSDHGHGHGHSHEPSRAAGPAPLHDVHRTFGDIKKIIGQSALSDWVKAKSVAVFERVAVAEGKIHGMPPEQVHFHEVGAVDSIIDIVGACIGLELLGKPRLLASAVIEGNGWVDCAHGRFPIPAPATLAILGARGIPLTQCSEPHELVTPTGAALLAELVEGFGPMEGLVAERIGFGLGTRDIQSRPNVLRAILVQAGGTNASHDWETDTVAVLETNLDDVNSEILGHFVEKALAEGALDVFHTPIQMKKSRPGVLLTVLCAEADADQFTELMLRETSSFGVRRQTAERRKLRREFVTVTTEYGQVQVKLGRLDSQVIQASPEFESCKQVAAQARVPLKAIYEAAVKAAKL